MVKNNISLFGRKQNENEPVKKKKLKINQHRRFVEEEIV